jgi:phage tail sheath protein FI
MAARFSLFGPTARGIQLLSDVSASSIGAWQPAGTVRLLGQLLRTARGVGESLTFENSGEGLWAQVRGRFEDLLTRYWEAGALRGARVTDAFSVRCDRSVMSQSDIDNGRVVVLIEFAAQTAIERVRVHLALAEDGSVFWQDAAAMDAVSVDATASGVTP